MGRTERQAVEWKGWSSPGLLQLEAPLQPGAQQHTELQGNILENTGVDVSLWVSVATVEQCVAPEDNTSHPGKAKYFVAAETPNLVFLSSLHVQHFQGAEPTQ